MIIALGFKIDNERAIQFRKWANEIVKEYYEENEKSKKHK